MDRKEWESRNAAWTTRFNARKACHYVEAVLWLALRDVSAVADWLTEDANRLYDQSALTSGFILSEHFAPYADMDKESAGPWVPVTTSGERFAGWRKVRHAFPVWGLKTALDAGAVVAYGRRGANGPIEPVPDLEWPLLKFSELPGRSSRIYASDGDLLSEMEGRGWYDIQIDRATLLSSFPALGQDDRAAAPAYVEQAARPPVVRKPVDLADVDDSRLLATHWPEIPYLHTWACAGGDHLKQKVCDALAERSDLLCVSARDLEEYLKKRKIEFSESSIRTLIKGLTVDLASLVRAQNPQNPQNH